MAMKADSNDRSKLLSFEDPLAAALDVCHELGMVCPFKLRTLDAEAGRSL